MWSDYVLWEILSSDYWYLFESEKLVSRYGKDEWWLTGMTRIIPYFTLSYSKQRMWNRVLHKKTMFKSSVGLDNVTSLLLPLFSAFIRTWPFSSLILHSSTVAIFTFIWHTCLCTFKHLSRSSNCMFQKFSPSTIFQVLLSK